MIAVGSSFRLNTSARKRGGSPRTHSSFRPEKGSHAGIAPAGLKGPLGQSARQLSGQPFGAKGVAIFVSLSQAIDLMMLWLPRSCQVGQILLNFNRCDNRRKNRAQDRREALTLTPQAEPAPATGRVAPCMFDARTAFATLAGRRPLMKFGIISRSLPAIVSAGAHSRTSEPSAKQKRGQIVSEGSGSPPDALFNWRFRRSAWCNKRSIIGIGIGGEGVAPIALVSLSAR